VTNNKRLYSTFCTVEANYWQTRSIARPLCDSRATCSSTCRDFPLNSVKDRLVTWLLQSGMDYLLTSDFHPLLTPSNAVWNLIFSNSPSTPLPCCPPSDCQWQCPWLNITTECARVTNACIINYNNIHYALVQKQKHGMNAGIPSTSSFKNLESDLPTCRSLTLSACVMSWLLHNTALFQLVIMSTFTIKLTLTCCSY